MEASEDEEEEEEEEESDPEVEEEEDEEAGSDEEVEEEEEEAGSDQEVEDENDDTLISANDDEDEEEEEEERFVVLNWNHVFLNNSCVKPYVPREPRRNPSNRRLNEHGIYIRHCQESNSQPVPSQVGVDPTRPLTVLESISP